ncbi:MAG: hypothetical protein A3D16_17735 [Rhodobacterales bacterium RIFCSPHIGHO2_02_FULL_62_130]|nr:MAG: hypothetical protein A3D16_17735 [Rhodobacterales bacterium RIFCSPHIGHO2_02_FULL_62_130]OHC53404.1 MAG: hypothetical protein A3E48_18920 [Rhodobacterales bacterium RIFCSPHIGHO2_12_FULL_62_75]HCY98450.1 type II toxin-antitoxin system HipA family toxin [Rhodobacter sp.]
MQIWFENQVVADLIPHMRGAQLRYRKDWVRLKGAFPVSTKMPLSAAIYEPDIVVPWIVALLPEEQNLAVISQITGTSASDLLGILHRIGRDTSGALSFEKRSFGGVQTKDVSDEAVLEQIINELPRKPFLVGEEGVSMSLAGVQNKIGVFRHEDGKLGIPVNGTPSTWILKPDSDRLYGSVWNEAFCMLLAKNCGLDTPEIRVGRAGKRRYILIKRYDRIVHRESGRIRRLHQEDFTQAAGLFTSRKYEKNGSGLPGLKISDIIEIIRNVMHKQSILEIPKFISYLIFNTIACNTDAHAKNYSFIISASRVVMTPIYDVMCAKPYPNITKYMANTIADKREGDYLQGRHWQREAKACGLSPSIMLKSVETLCNRVLKELDKTYNELVAMDAEGTEMAWECGGYIRDRAKSLLNGLKEKE